MLLMWAWLGGAVAATWPVAEEASEARWETREGGLQVQDLAVGEGVEVVAGSDVEVHYTGRLADGTVFDSSVDRGQTFAFSVGAGQVIAGWDQGLVGMKVGGKRRLEIPPELGYGDRAAGSIPPGSTLYFEIELFAVAAPRAAPAAARAVSDHRKGPRGLMIAEVEAGDGAKVKKGERVCVDLAVWVDGELRDHTFGKPSCWWFRYDHSLVMPGLTLGMKGMREGGVRQLRLPVELTKASSRSLDIEPGSDVLIDVELVHADGG